MTASYRFSSRRTSGTSSAWWRPGLDPELAEDEVHGERPCGSTDKAVPAVVYDSQIVMTLQQAERDEAMGVSQGLRRPYGRDQIWAAET
jgi:hypothetical protein